MDIHAINEELVKTLVKMNRIQPFSRKFNETKPNYEKVNLVEKILIRLNFMQNIEEKCNIRKEKSDEISKNLRNEGNDFFSLKSRNYFKAYEFYNKSLCTAKSNENLSLSYANRSAILFEWKYYHECLESIKFARAHEYPEKLKHKLEKREQECLRLMIKETSFNYENDKLVFKLSFGPHPKIPFISNCLEMKHTKDLGRYICTNQSLKPGDLISIEEEYVSCLLPSCCYIRCTNCTKESLNLIPCKYCTSAMFCNEKCQNEAKFHRIECSCIDFLFTLFTKIQLIALRVVINTLLLFDNIEECMTFINNLENHNLNAFQLNYGEYTKKEQYKGIHGLVTNQDKRDTGDLFQRAVAAAVLKNYLLNKSIVLKEFLSSEIGENFFSELLFQHLQTSPSNFHSCDLIEDKLSFEQSFATAAYPFGSLINHSCAPNIVRIYKNTKTYIFVLRPIKANEIILDNYGYHFATQSKETRIQTLQTQYHFKCNCEACEGNYKLFHDLDAPSIVEEIISESDIQSLLEHNKKFSAQKYKIFCDFLDHYSNFYPCAQIGSVEESLKMAFNILFDAIPLRLKVQNN